MASPPPSSYSFSPTALSPPFASHSQLPQLNTSTHGSPTTPASSQIKKRASIADPLGSSSNFSPGGLNNSNSPSSAVTAAPPLRRRKTSTISVGSTGSAHPLRQTSFPSEDTLTMSGYFGSTFAVADARSPSVDFDNASVVSGSQASVAGLPLKKKRGRKSKAEKAREQTPSSVLSGARGTGGAGAGRAASLASGGGAGGGGGADGRSTAAGAGGEQAEDEDEEGDPQMSIMATGRSEAQNQEEKKLRAMLTRCMDKDQFERYSNWRAAKLPDSTVRRVVNATVSQSVPNQIVTAVRTVTKFYLCDIIRIAREVQAEWIAAGNEPQAADPEDPNGTDMPWPGKVMSAEEEAAYLQDQQASLSFADTAMAGMGSSFATSFGRSDDADPEKREVILREPPRGPLRPDHLREAVRRYQSSAQNQGIGSLKVWNEQQRSGAERFPVRTGGRRVFR